MLEEIARAYPHCIAKNCLTTKTDKLVKIKDQPEECCCFAGEDEVNLILVENPNQIVLYYLFIDKCLFGKGSAFKKCDCAVFNDVRFCFIEFKQTVKNKEDYISSATDQLLSTVAEMKKLLNFDQYELECYVAFNDDPPIPAALTENQVHEKKFWDLHRSLFFIGNKISF